MANVWGYWDCPKCGSAHHRGDIDACPNCGAPRSPDIRFYLDKGNIERVAPELENKRPDWECDYCGCMNGAGSDTCGRCGAARGPDSRNYFSPRDGGVRPDNTASLSGMARDAVKIARAARPPRSVFTRRRVIAISAVALGLALIAMLCVYLFAPVSGHMRVLGASWSRDIYIDELRTFDESGWELPAGARLKRSNPEIKAYVPVIDHYEPRTEIISEDVIVGWHDETVGYRDLGNGQFEEITEKRPEYSRRETESTHMEPVYRDDPVWATKYYYEIDRWVESRSVSTSGHDKNPVWGEVSLGDNEREGRRAENYAIKGDEGEYRLDYDDWAGVDIGDEISFEYRRLGRKILRISGVPAA